MSANELVSVSLYDLATGVIVACLTSESVLVGTVQGGYGVVAGHHDGTKRRVNLATGEVEAFQPPAPDSDHTWDAAVEQWVLPPAVSARRAAMAAARAQIGVLEGRQARAVRELLLSQPGAAERLQAIDDEIAMLRADIGAGS